MDDKSASLRRFEEAARALAKRKVEIEFLRRTLEEIEAEEKRRSEAREGDGEGDS